MTRGSGVEVGTGAGAGVGASGVGDATGSGVGDGVGEGAGEGVGSGAGSGAAAMGVGVGLGEGLGTGDGATAGAAAGATAVGDTIGTGLRTTDGAGAVAGAAAVTCRHGPLWHETRACTLCRTSASPHGKRHASRRQASLEQRLESAISVPHDQHLLPANACAVLCPVHSRPWGELCTGLRGGQQREARTKVWTVATARGGTVGFLRALQALQDPPQSTPVSLPFLTPSEQVGA